MGSSPGSEWRQPMQPAAGRPGWTVLLIGGPSGAGKTVVAEQIGRRVGVPWLQVDDLRLALQWSRATLPTGSDDLYFFLETPDVWSLPPARLRDALIAVGEAMAPAIEIVVENHVATGAPLILEGDGINPSLLDRPAMRAILAAGEVRPVFLAEPDEAVVLANMLARDRGIAGRAEAELRTEARAKWLHGRWLGEEARRRGLPVVEPRPWASLPDRVEAATSRPRQV